MLSTDSRYFGYGEEQCLQMPETFGHLTGEKILLPENTTDEAGIFRGKDFYKHIALDCGVGLRLDLSFALLRLDLGFKTFNPASSEWIGPGKWFKHNNFEFSFGIGYPF
jgi:outer membrane protein assembly factor BamA